MSAYKKVFGSEDADIVLQDLACRVFGRVVSDETSDQALRAWSGEVKLFKYMLNKIYQENTHE